MNKINWKIRLRNKAFWLGAIPAALLLARPKRAPKRYTFDDL